MANTDLNFIRHPQFYLIRQIVRNCFSEARGASAVTNGEAFSRPPANSLVQMN
jgi:hypothetical protein